MVDTRHYLLKPIKCTTPRMNPKLKYGFWVTMLQPCRFTSCNKCTILASGGDNGKTYTRVGQVVCRKPLYLLFNFAVNLKLFFYKSAINMVKWWQSRIVSDKLKAYPSLRSGENTQNGYRALDERFKAVGSALHSCALFYILRAVPLHTDLLCLLL